MNWRLIIHLIEKSRIAKMSHICPPKRVWLLDNFARRLIHNPVKMFSPFVGQGMKVMDIGCGGGFASLGLAELVGENGIVYSVDIQQEMLDFVEKRARKMGIVKRFVFLKCKENTIEIEDNSFDFVNAFYVVHEAPDTENFIAEIYRLLKKDGMLFIAEPNFHVSRSNFQRTLELAYKHGFTLFAKPKVFFSLTAVLAK